MALQAAVHCDGYSYTETVDVMDYETIRKSRELFEKYKCAGIIMSGDYDDRQWTITDEVNRGAVINLQLDEVRFVREAGSKLACSLSDYRQVMRIVITSRFGYAIKTLQSDAGVLREFGNNLTVPTDYAQAQVLGDLLALLPGYSPYREEVQREIDDISPLLQKNGQQRLLAHYQSYLWFSAVLDTFWKKASSEEKVLYFPVWFWFCITGVLPLRPTECVLTPRNCISQKDGKYYLELRRSRKKGTRQETRYSLEQDYERRQYPIPERLASQIIWYISETEKHYKSDIDVLFCKNAQFNGAGVLTPNDIHYSYYNLKQCLAYFYRDIIQKRYGYTVVSDHESLCDGQIELIRLGDTRHISMISLALSGGSPSICRELAGHDSIEISSHYYSNLRTFLDAIGWERFREAQAEAEKAYGLSASQKYPVRNGFCQCEQVWNGEFKACESAVDEDGVPGSCEVCRWFLPSIYKNVATGELSQKEKAAEAIKQTCILFRQALEQIREGLGHEDTISSILDRLAAQSRRYIHQAVLELETTESEG